MSISHFSVKLPLLFIFCFSTLNAETIVVPNVAWNAEGDAFTGALAVPIRQQEVYSGSQFPATQINITELRFRPDVEWGATIGAFSAHLSRVQFRLSTTTRSPGELSYVFADNIGDDETLVYDSEWQFQTGYSGPVIGPKDFDIVLKLSKPFKFHGGKGNLLVDLRNYGRASAIYVHDDSRYGGLSQRIFIEDPDSLHAAAGDMSAAVMEVVYDPIQSAPEIRNHPLGQIARAGKDFSLSVSVIGTPPLTYQWFFNNSPIAGAVSQTLLLTRPSTNQTGRYSVAISNSLGGTVSSNALVSVQENLNARVVVPNAAETVEGDAFTAAFAVPIRQQEVYVASQFPGLGGEIRELRYRPDVDWGSLMGAFKANISRIQFRLSTTTRGPGDLSFVFDQNTGSDAIIVYDGPWNLETQYDGPARGPKNFDIVLKLQKPFFYDPTKGNLLIEVRCFDRAPNVFVHDDSRLPGLTQRLFIEDPNAERAAIADMNAAVVQVVFGTPPDPLIEPTPPVVTDHPRSSITDLGGRAIFEVHASGVRPFFFQWHFNGQPIAGATTDVLNFEVVNTNQAGIYSVSVSNTYGAQFSQEANLIVLDQPLGLSVVPSDSQKQEGDAYTAALAVPIHQQEVYSASQFPQVPLRIVELRYRPDVQYGGAVGPFSANLSHVSFRLSTTSKPPGGLSMWFSDNVGADETLVYDAPWRFETKYIGGTEGPKKFDIVLRLERPFLYDPSKGNLLVDLRNYGRSPDVYVHDDQRSSLLQRIFVENPDAKEAGGGDLSAAVLQIGFIREPAKPSIVDEPDDINIEHGGNASFLVEAQGAIPMSYQWFFNGVPIQGGTSNSLTIPRIGYEDAGGYQVEVSNHLGFVRSRAAALKVLIPPSRLRVPDLQVDSGSEFKLPLELVANGRENGVAFSISFNRRLLGFKDLTVSSKLLEAFNLVNTNELSVGRIGFALILGSGQTFPSGTNLLAELLFSVAPSLVDEETSVVFGDSPVTREIVDVAAISAPGYFEPGAIHISFSGFEGDVAPRFNPDGKVSVADWVQVGRFVAGLDDIGSSSEFRSADCAPSESGGDGLLTIRDWVQSGRYAASLDAVAVAGGPFSNILSSPLFGPPSLQDVATTGISLEDFSGEPGQTVSVPITLTALGGEAAIGFSIKFDPAILTFESVEPDAQAGGALFNINSKQSSIGRVGIALALPGGTQFSAGSKRIARAVFTVKSVRAGSSALTFDDVPVVREVVNGGAKEMAAAYGPGAILIATGAPEIHIAVEGSSLVVTWPASASGFVLESSPAIQSPVWAAVGPQPVEQGQVFQVKLPTPPDGQTYFRLRQ